jgi:hypothetical protein
MEGFDEQFPKLGELLKQWSQERPHSESFGWQAYCQGIAIEVAALRDYGELAVEKYVEMDSALTLIRTLASDVGKGLRLIAEGDLSDLELLRHRLVVAADALESLRDSSPAR